MEMDQDEYIKTLRPITSSELTGAPAEEKATKHVANMFVSLRGAIAYCVLTQFWIMVSSLRCNGSRSRLIWMYVG